MEPGMSGSLVMACATVRANKFGQIIPSMKDTGLTTGLTAEEDSFMRMEMFMRASGRTIKLTEMEYTPELTDPLIPDNGQKIYNTDTASKSGMMVLPTKENIFRDSNRDMESSPGLTARSTRAISKRISWRASAK